MDWIEKEVPISDIDALLENGFEVEVDSPDGWVGVNFYINKGLYEEYLLTTENNITVSCNESHLFETEIGWVSAKDMTKNDYLVKTPLGFVKSKVSVTGKIIPIVDINVNHENHRYYTNNISSHNTGVGKSLFMCHHAANCWMQNKNVLYITCEMAEERIAERIDANLMDTTLDDLKTLPQDVYIKKLERIEKNITSKLIIKEYPTASANANHFRFLLDELQLKKKFTPDIIFIDYLNICASARFKANGSVNSYTYIKAIAEELRGLAVERNVPIFTATQTNRQGYSNSDVGLEDTSESFGLPATADFMFAIMTNEEFEKNGQILVKQLKNRYNDLATKRKFLVGVNKSKMKLYDLEESAQDGLVGTGEEDDIGTEGFDNKFKKNRDSYREKANSWKMNNE